MSQGSRQTRLGRRDHVPAEEAQDHPCIGVGPERSSGVRIPVTLAGFFLLT